jgi:hypothetical protein
MDFKINDLDDRYRRSPNNWTEMPERFSKYKKCTEYCNVISLWSFIIGAIFFFIYAYMVQNHNFQNLTKKEEITMTDKKKPPDAGKTETSDKVVPVKKGQTEAPERIIKPEKPKEK